MLEKICPICGTTFIEKYPKILQKFCSKKCRNINYNIVHKEQEKLRHRLKGVKAYHANPEKFKNKARIEREKRGPYYNKLDLAAKWLIKNCKNPKYCKQCGEKFIYSTNHKRFCSEECCNKNYSDQHKENHRKHYINNKEKIIKRSTERYKNNKEYIRIKVNRRTKVRKEEDPVFKLKYTTRRLIQMSFKRRGLKKNSKTEQILGCSLEHFRKHIEKQLPIGKTLKDLGYYGYHIDHIIPLATATTVEEVIKLCHYTNLQPLWWKDNLEKRAKLDYVSKSDYSL